MASNPLGYQILEAVKTALQGINGSSSYHNNIYSRVSMVQTSSPTIHEFPQCHVIAAKESATPQINFDSEELYEATLDFETWGWDRDTSDPQKAAHLIAMDMRTAIEKDTTLGGLVCDVKWTASEYWLSDDKTGVGIAVVRWTAIYFVNRQTTSGGI